MTTPRTPPLLDPYLTLPPEASLVLLTSVLGATTNWLVLRHLHSLLAPGSSGNDGSSPGGGSTTATAVVLASYMRDLAFWRDGAARLGVDLEALGMRGRFAFVDGLGGGGRGRGRDAAGDVGRAVDSLLGAGAERVVLVVDQVDLMLAAAGGEMSWGDVREMLMGLREKVHALILTLSADEPLVSSQTTTLEKEHAALVLSAAHEAEMVMSLRLLDTGTAKDVSGVIRITRGGAESERSIEEREYLYHVVGDGGVRVFERGQ